MSKFKQEIQDYIAHLSTQQSDVMRETFNQLFKAFGAGDLEITLNELEYKILMLRVREATEESFDLVFATEEEMLKYVAAKKEFMEQDAMLSAVLERKLTNIQETLDTDKLFIVKE